MASKFERKNARKQREWRVAAITALSGCLAAIVLWIGIIWLGIKMD
ncbi:hypothetical protein ACHHV8_29260 [Paenibacillus sp. TAB 01]